MRKKVIPAYIVCLIVVFSLYFLMKYIEPIIAANNYIPGFVDILQSSGNGELVGRIQWILKDFTEPMFYGAVIPSIFLLIFGIISWWREKKGKTLLGFPILGGSGNFWPVLLTGACAMIITNIIYKGEGWIPTFAPLASVAPVLVLTFGNKPIRLVTSAVFAGVFTYPVANLFATKIAGLGLPAFSGVAIAMALVSIIGIEICNLLPWMIDKKVEDAGEIKEESIQVNPIQKMSGWNYFYGRLFADPGETVFWGSPLAIIGLYIGAILTWILNPLSINYGSGRFPIFLLGTMLTSATAILLWYPKYYKEGFVFTFTAAVCSGAILNTYAISTVALLVAIVLSSILVPGMVHLILEKVKITRRWHPCPVALFSLGVLSIVISFIFLKIPGFII